MELITTVAAILTGLVTLVVGMFSLVSIWFDDLP
jgi:hypothetical protein